MSTTTIHIRSVRSTPPQSTAHAHGDLTTVPNIAAVLRVGVPATKLAVLALSTLGLWLLDVPIGEAFGIGAYLCFWIGGGFGVILSSAYREHRQDRADIPEI